MIRIRLLSCALLLALAPAPAWALDFEFKAPPGADDPGVPPAMRDLAERMLPVYQEADNQRFLANLSALQLADSNYAAADDSRQSLRERQKNSGTGQPDGRAVAMDLYVHARTLAAAGTAPLAQAFTQTFREVVPRLGDREAYAAAAWLATPPQSSRDALQVALDRSRAGNSLSEDQALELIWTYLALDAQRSVGAVAATLAAEDDRRRYVGADETVIRGAHGADIHIRVLRPKGGAAKRPALLEYALDPDPNDARACAAHGYAGVLAYTRTHGKSAGVAPFLHEGEDARAVIRWIAKQPWSDGRVGMYGEGYSAFAAWSAARHLPPPLKAIASADAMAPGIDFPAEGRVFRNAALPWALAAQSPDGGSGQDAAQWRALDQKWYRSGRPYRDYGRIGGLRNPLFDEWLAHPSYDRYWQKMIPFGKQFGRIGIPVLSIGGYYADGGVGALYYFRQHLKYRAKADHTLLLGPYGTDALRDGPSPLLRGYAVDPAALLDLRELRLRWFDHLFRNATLPPQLSDRVNYQLMGADEWRHAPSLEAMGNSVQRLYLDPAGAGERHRLSAAVPPDSAFTSQVLNFADRRDADWTPPATIIGRGIPLHYGLAYASEPLPQPLELTGALSGRLDFELNRMDLDLSLTLYEQTAAGEVIQLAAPYTFRASYAGGQINRRLLREGERQQLDFSSERISARKLQAGSRIVLALEVNKRPDRQLNYGGGNEVSDEAQADVYRHLRIRWYGGSYIELPLRK
ncbi:MAG TPA: CocE/NonD family hydrolase [Nevskia sp.]|nr:CocE/NonD family hydrolase [Nevskia sp.]